MPFAHCPPCGTSVLVDPSGRCPEGHTVGAAGARIAASLGSSGPHPEEPEPWVADIELDAVSVEDLPEAPRVARPPTVAGLDEPDPADGRGTEDLLRELHALGDLTGPSPAAPAASSNGAATPPPPPAVPPHAAAPGTPAPPPPPFAPPAARPTPPPSAPPTAPPTPPAPPAASAVATPEAPSGGPAPVTDLEELASLAAAVRSVDERSAVAPTVSGLQERSWADTAAPVVHPVWDTTGGAAAAPAAPAVTDPVVAVPPPPALRAVEPLVEPPDTPATTAPAIPPAAGTSIKELFQASANGGVEAGDPAAAADGAGPDLSGAPAPVPGPVLDGSNFTARGDGVGRRTQRRLEEKQRSRLARFRR